MVPDDPGWRACIAVAVAAGALIALQLLVRAVLRVRATSTGTTLILVGGTLHRLLSAQYLFDDHDGRHAGRVSGGQGDHPKPAPLVWTW